MRHAVLLRLGVAVVPLAFVLGPLPSASAGDGTPQPGTPIKHFIVLMQENHTFDSYFGTYPGADGIAAGTCMPVHPGKPESGCVKPFHLGSRPIQDLDHSAETARIQYNDGRMNGFVHALTLRNQNGAQAMGYYDGRDLPLYWNIADRYVLFDRFFSSDRGGSLENHMFWVAGRPGTDLEFSERDGFGDLPTIFDRLEEQGISWKFYVENYDPAINYRTVAKLLKSGENTNRVSQVVWVPPLNFARFLDDPTLSRRIVDLDQYFEDLQNDTLPAVAYIAPSGSSEHPPGSIAAGQRFVRTLINTLMQSRAWSSSALLVTYDDWGGWYDHVKPPQVDQYGYGFRVPAFMVSAYARKAYIDHTTLDFTSILKFIEDNYSLEPLAPRDARARSLAGAFDFTRPPREPEIIPITRGEAVEKNRSPQSALFAAYGVALSLGALLMAVGVVGTALLRRRSAQVLPLPSPGRGTVR